MPKKILVSVHAKRRLQERLGITAKKIPALVRKAWDSTDNFSKKRLRREYVAQFHPHQNRVTRELMGYTFVFADEDTQVVLVTVL